MDKSKNSLNKILFSKYRIKSLIGKGQCSEIFSVENITNKKLYAAKIEKIEAGKLSLLKNESFFLYNSKGFGIPEIITYGHSGKHNILIQQLLGKNLKELFKKNKNKIKDLCMSAIQIIDRIEYIHSKYIVHRDIKPENFLIGNPDSSTIYIIDFGFAKKYRSSRTKKHIMYRVNKFFPGTIAFLSLNASKGIEQTRRDDLESLAYSLIFLGNGSLPWINIKAKTLFEYSVKIYDVKKNASIENLCKNLPKELVIFTEYVRNLKFDEEPNYNYLRSLFIDVLKKINQKNDSIFYWINKNDRNEYLNLSNRTRQNSLHKKKISMRKRILENLEKLRTVNKCKNNKSIENFNRNKSYNNIINYNLESKKVKSSINIKKINNLTVDENENFRKKSEIKTEQNKIEIFSPQHFLKKLNNKQLTTKNGIIYTNIKNDNKNYEIQKKKDYLFYIDSIPPNNSMTNVFKEFNNNIDYIPKTEKGLLMYNNYKSSTSIFNPNNSKNSNKKNNNLKVVNNKISHNKEPKQLNNSIKFIQNMYTNIDVNINISNLNNIKNNNLSKFNNIIRPAHISPKYNSNFNFNNNNSNIKTIESFKIDTIFNNRRNNEFNFFKLNKKTNAEKYGSFLKNINL